MYIKCNKKKILAPKIDNVLPFVFGSKFTMTSRQSMESRNGCL